MTLNYCKSFGKHCSAFDVLGGINETDINYIYGWAVQCLLFSPEGFVLIVFAQFEFYFKKLFTQFLLIRIFC